MEFFCVFLIFNIRLYFMRYKFGYIGIVFFEFEFGIYFL